MSAPKTTKVFDIMGALNQAQTDLQQTKQDLDKIKASQELSKQRIQSIEAQKTAIESSIRQINQTKREAPRTGAKVSQNTLDKIAKTIAPPTLDTSKSPINTLQKASDSYFKASGLSRVQSNAIRTNKPVNPPKNLTEFTNRFKYLGTQLTIGGLKEFTFPASAKLAQPRNVGETTMQMAGGLLTPSPADLLLAQTIKKLRNSERGRRLLNKVLNRLDDGKDPFRNADEAVQWEKLVGKDGLSTNQIRNMDKAELKKWMREIEEYYKAHPKAARVQSVITEEQVINDIAITDLDWNDDQWINFLEGYGRSLRPDLAVSILSNLPASKRKEVIGTASDDIEKMREAYLQTFKQKQPSAEISETAIAQEQKPEDRSIIIEGSIPDISQGTVQEPVPFSEAPEVEPTQSTEPVPETPPLILPRIKERERRKMNFEFYKGKKSLWRVKYSYKGGKGESLTVEAQSLPEAIARAQQAKQTSKTQPRLIDIQKVR